MSDHITLQITPDQAAVLAWALGASSDVTPTVFHMTPGDARAARNSVAEVINEAVRVHDQQERDWENAHSYIDAVVRDIISGGDAR